MADNSILAGRLTVDTSEFTRQITNAINDANKQIRNLGNTGGGSGSGGGGKNNPYAEQIKNVRALQQELKNLTQFYRDYNTALKVGNNDGMNMFTRRIEEAKTNIEALRTASRGLKQDTEESSAIHKKASEVYQRAQNLIQNEAKKTADAQTKAAQEQIKQTTEAYRNLKTAISEYQKAGKIGDTNGQAYWSEQINGSYQTLQNIKSNINELGLEENQREKILNLIQQGEGAMNAFNAQQQQSVSFADGLANQWNKISMVLKMVSGFSIYKIFSEALSYAKDFDAALTDISVITMKTRAETQALGDTYHRMANDLRVTSTEIAKAAATIFRQGFTDPSQAQAVVRGATKFGAVTGVGTDAAIKNMTAAIQNFYDEGEDIGAFVEHLGDVWSYMGDTVATTGEDISIAMAKTSASVDSVGVSMEKASAWAAIMLAKTQQGGQIIGTQMNSLIARYAKITSKGYAKVTSDDEGEALSFNDVSTALSKAGIELYDVASKTFLPMSEMMDQLHSKWDSLDEATQKYIATTLGGTRGMNYLLTLLENYDDALELQAGIQDGMVNSKYEAWMQGVEAAQNNLTNSMENLYSFLNSDMLIGFYNGMAGIVDMFVSASDALGGLNLKLPILAAGVLGVLSAIFKLKQVFSSGGGFLGMLSTGNIGLIVGGLLAVATAIGAIVSAVKNANRIDVTAIKNTIGENNTKISSLQNVIKELDEFKGKAKLSADEMERFSKLRAAIVQDSPSLQYAYGQEGEKILTYADAIDVAVGKLDQLYARNAALRSQMYEENKNSFLKNAEKIVGESSDAVRFDFQPDKQTFSDYVENSLPFLMTFFNPKELTLTALEEFKQALIDARSSQEYKNAPKDVASAFDDIFDEAMSSINDNIILRRGELTDLVKNLMPDLSGMFDAETQVEMSKNAQSFMSDVIAGLFSTDAIFTPEGYARAETAAKEIWKVYSSILTEGMNSDTLVSLATAANGYSIDPINDIIQTYLDAWNNLHSSSDFEPAADEAVQKGLTIPLMKSINNAFASLAAANLNDEELMTARSQLLNSILEILLGDDQELIKKFGEDFSIALPVNVKPVLPEETEGVDTSGAVKKYSEEVRAAINDTKELKQAIDALADSEGGHLDVKLIEKLANAYPQLNQALQAYADAIDSEDADAIAVATTALSDMMQQIYDNAEGFAGLGQIETITEFMDKLTSGDYDVSDIESIVNLLGLTMENLEELSPEDLMDKLNELLEEQTEQWGGLAEAMGVVLDKYKSFSDQVEDAVHPLTTAQKAIQKLNKDQQLNVSEVSELIKLYPDLADELSAYGKDTKDTTKLITELNKHVADDAMTEWINSVETAVKKIENAKTGTKDYTSAIVELSNAFDFQGMGQLENLDFVTQNLDNIRAAANGSADAFRALQEAAWVNILGTSSVDFSNIQNGIALVGENAERLAQILVSLGYFEVETKQVTSAQEVITGLQVDQFGRGSLQKSTVTLGGTYQILKPAASNPFAGRGISKTGSSGGSGGGGGKGNRGGGGGGGGGGSSTINVSEATQTMLDTMSEGQDNFTNRLKLIQLKKEYHDIRGELQGVIGYTRLEASTIQEQNKTLEENIDKLAREIESKQAIIAKNKSTSTAYKQAAKDLEELNKTHKEYTEKLQENINDLENLRKELDKLEEQARQTVITVQDLIRDTLKGQKEYERGILDGTVELEDKIVEIIKTRYEKERDLAIETANKKKELLQEEIDKIDELIDERRKLIEKEEESAEIAELQAKIARISADPTRRKEMMELQAQLAEKQKDLAWETYEEELQAQKDSLNEQIDNIDEYIDSVQEYYEDLFEHPKKLIAEMKEIIKQSDSEIIEWLKRNSDEWADYTEAKRQQTEEDWQGMIDNMRGVTETYRDEVAEIMRWTDDEIMKWLQENNVEFKNATKEQQESFLYSWKESLNNWRNAYKSIVAEINATTYSSPSYSSGGGGGGGGYSGGGGSSYVSGGSAYSAPAVTTPTQYATPSAGQSIFTAGSAPQTKTYTGHATYYYVGGSGSKIKDTEQVATSVVSYADAIKKAKDQAMNHAKSQALSSWQTYRKANAGLAKDWIKYNQAYLGITKNPPDSKYVWFGNAYKQGGEINYTGPAWVDGTPGKPEGILNAPQWRDFQDLLATLHAIHTVSVSGLRLPNGGDEENYGGNVNIEQIVIQPQSLSEDADYDLIAERVGESIMEGLNRTMVIGGIRI